MDRTDNVRNVCIISHVDHGKSSLADHLLSKAGLLSRKLAGQMRYLDSRKDEQERGITMKSSPVTLIAPDLTVHLIDSPGHVDFSAEVSAAVRLADGALVLIDVVEGICAQTETVMRQAWKDKLGMVLVLNKIDRLIADLQMTPLEAFHHLRNLIEQVNAFVSSFHVSEAFFKDEEIDDANQLSFDPLKGNVVFASAMDGWAFRIPEAARFFGKKLEMKESALAKVLWGEFYLNPKTKKVQSKPYKSKKEVIPLFVQFVLKSVWRVYDDVLKEEHLQKMKKIVDTLELKIHPRDLHGTDFRSKLQAIMSTWFPLANCIFSTMKEMLPSPLEAQLNRQDAFIALSKCTDQQKLILKHVQECDTNETAPVVVFVAKMIAVEEDGKGNVEPTGKVVYNRQPYQRGKMLASQVTPGKDSEQSGESENRISTVEKNDCTPFKGPRFVALSRVFSGVLRKDTPLLLLSADGVHQKVSNIELALFSGRSLEPVQSVPAGNIVGIYGLEEYILDTATLSSSLDCPIFSPLSSHSFPIIKVALSPVSLGTEQFKTLQKGLDLLSKADPNIEVFIEDTGEYVLVTCGELHLERCLTDLSERFAKGLKLNVSEPIVSFRETIVSENAQDSKEETFWVSDTEIGFKIQAVPIPAALEAYFLDHVGDRITGEHIDQMKSMVLRESSVNLCQSHLLHITAWETRNGLNLLICPPSEFSNAITTGFSLACKFGPLCEEAVTRVAFIVELVTRKTDHSQSASTGAVTGQMIATVKDACRSSFMQKSVRLVEAMFKVEFLCTIDGLGKLFGLLEQRRGRILNEYPLQGTNLFQIDACIPVVESFGFSREVRLRTKGTASPQMSFSHWEILDMDPFWKPLTQADCEEFGDESSSLNLAMVLITKVRKRKGLYVKEHVVEHAEKQRTLKH